MSFNAKNLSYEAREPSFLRNLKSQVKGRDPSLSTTRQPIPKRARQHDDEDEPVYVDEENNSLSKEQYDALLKDTKEEPDGDDRPNKDAHKDNPDAGALTVDIKAAGSAAKPTSERKEKDTGIGGRKKTTKARAIGGDLDEDQDKRSAPTPTSTSENRPKKPKAKKIKLSFEDGDI